MADTANDLENVEVSKAPNGAPAAEPAAPHDQPELKLAEAQDGQVPTAETPKPVEQPEPSKAGEASGEQHNSRAEPPDEAVVAKLKEYLADESMSMDVTERQLRNRLEEHFGVPLKERKGIIRAEVVSWLSAKQAAEEPEDEAEEEEEEPKKRKRKGGGLQKKCFLSEELQALLGKEHMSRPKVVKALWAYIRENNLQNPQDKRKIIIDEKLGKVFKPPLTMFSMNKQLSKHIGPAKEDAEDEDDSEQEEEAAPRKPKKAKQASGSGVRKPGGFAKPLALSPELQAWLGKGTAARSEVTKHFWAYVKEKQLQNPDNKREILCDETLQRLTGKQKFDGFSHAKFFQQHFRGYADAEPQAEAEPETAEADGAEAANDDD